MIQKILNTFNTKTQNINFKKHNKITNPIQNNNLPIIFNTFFVIPFFIFTPLLYKQFTVSYAIFQFSGSIVSYSLIIVTGNAV